MKQPKNPQTGVPRQTFVTKLIKDFIIYGDVKIPNSFSPLLLYAFASERKEKNEYLHISHDGLGCEVLRADCGLNSKWSEESKGTIGARVQRGCKTPLRKENRNEVKVGSPTV